MMNKQRGHFMKIKKFFIFLFLQLHVFFCITGCSNNDSKKESKKLRDSSPQLYLPSTDYQVTYQKNNVSVDASHTSFNMRFYRLFLYF